MSAQHTPGPWFCTTNGTVFALHDEPLCNRFFAQVQGGRRDDAQLPELLANARLMAAAPELLEALRVLETLFTPYASDSTQRIWIDNARAAIAKATGSAA